MPSAAITPTDQRPPGHARDRAFALMHAIADGLTDHGLDILGQEWTGDYFLKVTNVWGVACEATIGADGSVTWEYRPVHDGAADPAPIAAMVVDLLGAGRTVDRSAPPGRYPGQTLQGAVGLAARRHGLQACLGQVIRNEAHLEVHVDVEVTNPARPDRGRVWVTDNCTIQWECTCGDPAGGIPGIDLAEIVRTIGKSAEARRA